MTRHRESATGSRRVVLRKVAAATVAGTAGCLGAFGDGDTRSDTDLLFRNNTQERRTLSFSVVRPLGWTPAGTKTRTADGFKTVTTREVTAEPNGERRLSGVFPDSGSFVLDGELDVTNDLGAIEGRTTVSYRTTASTVPRPVELAAFYLEQSPRFDQGDELPRREFHDLVFLNRPNEESS